MPLRMGGGVPRLQRIVESLQSGRGAAYSTDQSTAVWVENNAIGRIIDRDMYGVHERLANQFLPTGCTADGLLPRWEAIFGITPATTDTEGVRRARLAAKWATIGLTNSDQPIRDALSAALGPLYVGLSYVTPANAISWWPGLSGQTAAITNFATGTGTITGLTGITTALYGLSIVLSNCATSANNGTYLILSEPSSSSVTYSNGGGSSPDYGVGGTIGSPTVNWSITNPAVPWSSTISHIDIQVQQPSTYSNAQFYAAISLIGTILDPIMPAWATWDWWVPSPNGGGNMGFYLDEPNLDIEVFDV